jgi:NAD-dependent DNA ligase
VLELSKKYINLDKISLKKEDIKILQSLISYHSDLYYNKDEPIISDSEYDDLFKKLEYLEDKYKINFKQTALI